MIHNEGITDKESILPTLVYPRTPHGHLIYDFIYLKNNTWFYLTTHHSLEWLKKRFATIAEQHSEGWRIIDITTGEIIDSNASTSMGGGENTAGNARLQL